MSTLYNRIETVTSASLSDAVDAAAKLKAQLSELNELRERVRKAQLSARRSRRTNHRKRPFHLEKEAVPVGRIVRDGLLEKLTHPSARVVPRNQVVAWNMIARRLLLMNAPDGEIFG
jgi:hypothetical protein